MPTVDLALAHQSASATPVLRGLLGLIDTLPGPTAD
jgi:hypothetical protein